MPDGVLVRAVRAGKDRAAAAAVVRDRVAELAQAVAGHLVFKEQDVALAFVLCGGLGEDGLFELCAALLESAESSASTRSTPAKLAFGLTESACAIRTSCAQQSER